MDEGDAEEEEESSFRFSVRKNGPFRKNGPECK
jgi:hypothetical protein